MFKKGISFWMIFLIILFVAGFNWAQDKEEKRRSTL
jgi:cbb3-type cytochrome oxidase subunit 3